MKRWLLALSLAFFSISMLPELAEARRLGGGGSAGLKRDMPARTAPDAVPAKPAQNSTASPSNAAAPTAAAATAKRSWMGPIAGLAAGLGLAALASHLGLGEELASVMMIALLALVAIVVVRLLLRRFSGAAASPAGMRLAGAGAPVTNDHGAWRAAAAAPMPPAGAVEHELPASAPSVPGDFDAAGFARIAKMIFIRMQAANDAGDLNDLRAFTTPEMFAAIRLDLQDRQGAAQQTDVVQIDAEVLDVAQETERQVVSVRFHGLIREAREAGAMPFDEVWHLVRAADGSREWAIAGIQQMAAAH
ncbi:TIM44-like domain-containing protein [uncultured Piscinibacter sp.]|uniref:Tim44 domain-containing protein n=1 Tax=uncultured Piscinibacter sp. TaxID=1131835 RepID=UPI00261A3C4C|nr:TIM44-like domain-containing protein [uncultured Piscinibacter sp.]